MNIPQLIDFLVFLGEIAFIGLLIDIFSVPARQNLQLRISIEKILMSSESYE